jgi:hypothetical protein
MARYLVNIAGLATDTEVDGRVADLATKEELEGAIAAIPRPYDFVGTTADRDAFLGASLPPNGFHWLDTESLSPWEWDNSRGLWLGAQFKTSPIGSFGHGIPFLYATIGAGSFTNWTDFGMNTGYHLAPWPRPRFASFNRPHYLLNRIEIMAQPSVSLTDSIFWEFRFRDGSTVYPGAQLKNTSGINYLEIPSGNLYTNTFSLPILHCKATGVSNLSLLHSFVGRQVL